MPLFMDIHDFGARISAVDIADAHAWDREVERHRQVRFRGCWVDEEAGRVFCLLEAPDASVAAAVHRDSHGLVAHEVHEVRAGNDAVGGRNVRAGHNVRAGDVDGMGHAAGEGRDGREGRDGHPDAGRSG